MKKIKFKNLIDQIDLLYPTSLAEDWDQVGLHFGHPKNTIEKVMVALDMRPQVVEEAVERGVDTLVLHHPPIFKAVERFNMEDPQIRMYAQAIKADLNVFAMHTNFDRAEMGMNDLLAQKLSLQDIQPLSYDQVGFPNLARIGSLAQAMDRETLIAHVKRSFNRSNLKIIERDPKPFYQEIAVIGGSGSSMMDEIALSGADVFITGDITYHSGHDLYELDLMTIDAGHYIESAFSTFVSQKLQTLVEAQEWDLEIVVSEVSTDPFEYQ